MNDSILHSAQKKKASMTRKFHNYTMQINQRHREEEIQNTDKSYDIKIFQ